ncbi:MAG TPA: iron-sulfur cluster assembly scaffold protein [Candidatus Polarisedimenticolia bacterium]|nr:iron-sulfur cluster assembly scaffold protein [Candidatus Polarisedimenticolia bacterium]
MARCADLPKAGSFDPKDPDVGTGVAGSMASGDLVKIQLRIRRERIQQARFKAFGCTGSIASASLASEWAEGKTLREAAEIKEADLSAALELPSARRHCSALAEKALRAAIHDYRNKSDAAAAAHGNDTSGGTG